MSDIDPWYPEITHIIHLKKLGARLFIYQTKLIEQEELNTVIANIKATLGRIDGVIHTAGEVNPSPFMNKNKTSCHSTFIPKIYGTYNLIHALQQTPIDFLVFISSLSSIKGGLGLVDYSAANTSLDSFADSALCSFATLVQSINWNTWRETGLTKKHAPGEDTFFLGDQNEITSYEGQQLFINALTTNENHMAISRKEPTYTLRPKEKKIRLKPVDQLTEQAGSHLTNIEKK